MSAALGLLALLIIQGAPTSRALGVVTGQVRNMDGTPARELRVSAFAAPDNGAPDAASSMLAALAQTDANGRFRLEDVPPGRYFITAGFLDSPTYYPGVASIATAKPLSLTPGGSINGIDFQLVRSAGVKVSGSVKGAPPGALQGLVRVALLPSSGARGGGPIEGATKPDGSFEFQKVSPGTYGVRLNPSATGQTPTITIADKDMAGIEITAPPMLFGRVNVDDGSPLPVQAAALALGAPDAPALIRIQARRDPVQTPSGGASPTVAVRADGTFLLPNINGEYRLTVTMLPLGYRVKSMTLGPVDLTQTNFRAPEAGAPNSAEIRVALTTAPAAGEPEGVTVSGKLMGLPVEGTPAPRWVSMQSPSPAPGGNAVAVQRIGETPLRADGTFEIKRVPPGTYSIRVLGPGANGPPTSVAVQDRDVTGVQLTVATNPPTGATASIAQQFLSLGAAAPMVQPGVKVAGSVTVPLNSAARPDAIALLGNSSDRSVRASIAADGTFEFAKVLPGTYSVATLPFGLLPAFTTIYVGAADLTGLRIEAPALSIVRGRTVMANGSLPSALKMSLRLQLADGSAWVNIEPDGTFSQKLPHGEYRVSVESAPAGFKIQAMRSGAVDLLGASLMIESAATPEILITLAAEP